MITIDEINKINDKKSKIKKEIYKKIYEQICRKIRHTVEIGGKKIIFIVPPIVLGFPTFDREKAAVYLKRQLENGGFNVIITESVIIDINWANKKKRNTHDDNDETEKFPSLINLKKAASKYINKK